MSKGRIVSATSPEFSRTAVIVLGMHRSGTSALAGVLSHLGCDLPATLMQGNESNPKGFFESDKICRLNDDLLASGGSDWSDWQRFNPDWFETSRASEFVARATEVLASEFESSSLFVLKDPRMCRLMPFWTRVIESAGIQPVVVHTHRNPLEVADSLSTIWTHTGQIPQLGPLLWLQNVLSAEQESRGLPRCFVSYENLLSNWAGEVDRISKTIGLRWPRFSSAVASEIDTFLTPSLRHHEKSKSQVLGNPLVSQWVSSTYATLQSWVEHGEQPEDHNLLDQTRVEFDSAGPSFAPLIALAKTALRKLHEQEAMVSNLQAQLQDSNASLQSRKQLNDQLTERCDVLSAQAAQLTGQLSQTNNLISELRLAHDSLQEGFGQKAAELKSEQTQKATLEAERQRLLDLVETRQQELAAVNQSKGALEAERESLSRHLSEATIAYSQASQALSDAQSALEAERNALALAQSALRQKEQEAQSWQSAEADARQQLAQTQDAQAQAAAAAERLAAELEQQRLRTEQLQLDLDQSSSALEAERNALALAQSAVLQKELEAQSWQSAEADARQQLAQTQDAQAQAAAAAERLAAELEQQRLRTEQLQLDLDQSSSALEAERNALALAQSALLQKEQEAQSWQSAEADARQKLAQTQDAQAQASAAAERLAAELEQQRQRTEQLQLDLDQSASALEAERNALALAQSAVLQRRKEADDWQAADAMSRQELAKIRAELSQTQAARDQALATSSRLTSEMAQLTQGLLESESRHWTALQSASDTAKELTARLETTQKALLEERQLLMSHAQQITGLHGSVAQMSAILAEKEQQIAAQAIELKALLAAREELYASTSWRVTAPLRWVRTVLSSRRR